MKVIPVAAPVQQDAGQSQGSQDARARAIARLSEQPVQNASSVQPEEMGAIRANTNTLESAVEQQRVEPKAELDESPAAEQKSEDPLSSQYALLARREKALRAKAQQQEQVYKAREEALKAKEAALAVKDAEYQTGYISKAQLKTNTLAALEDAQVSYDEITQAILNNQTPLDPRTQNLMAKMEAKISKLEAELGEGKKAQSDQQTQAYQAAVKQIETDVRALVKLDPAYETVRETNSIKDVVELIEQTYKEEGTLLSVEEAAQLVEDELLSQIDRLTKIEKVKNRLSPKPAASEQVQAQTPSKPTPQQQPMKTLTNANSSTRQLSARERALLAFKGELKTS